MALKTLHITNGDSAVELFKAGNLAGEFLPWRDVLHIGPVIDSDDLNEVSDLRACYLAYLNWDTFTNLQNDFRNRDLKLTNYKLYDEIYLWFEHDLYDQLQLIQILDYMSDKPALLGKSYLIQTTNYLNYYHPEQVQDLFATAKQVSKEQVRLAANVFKSFKKGDIEALRFYSNHSLQELPCLSEALIRLLGELPDETSGCTQTESYILDLVDSGFNTKAKLFKEYCQREQSLFHGDLGFFWIVDQMINDKPSLLELQEKTYKLTDIGRQVLHNQYKWERSYSSFQWLGGHIISGHSLEDLKKMVLY